MSGPAANTRKPDYAERVIRSLPRRLARLMAMHCLAGWRYSWKPPQKAFNSEWIATHNVAGNHAAPDLQRLIAQVEARINQMEVLRMRRETTIEHDKAFKEVLG